MTSTRSVARRWSNGEGRLATGWVGVAQASETVILSLTDSEAVRAVAEGPGGVLEANQRPRWIIDTSTGGDGDLDDSAVIRKIRRRPEMSMQDVDARDGAERMKQSPAPAGPMWYGVGGSPGPTTIHLSPSTCKTP